MSNLLEYIEQNPQESKRLIGLEYKQLKQLIELAQLRHEQKKFYSGKKKNHTLKNQFIVTTNGQEIVDVAVTVCIGIRCFFNAESAEGNAEVFG